MVKQKRIDETNARQIIWNPQEKRKAISMVQAVFDQLAKAFLAKTLNKKRASIRPLEYLQFECEDLLEHLDQAPVPMAAVETFCVRFREITPSDLKWFWHGSSSQWEGNEKKMSPARKFGWALETLLECCPFKRMCMLPSGDSDPPFWAGLVASGRSIKPSGNPFDRAPVWNPATCSIYVKNIYRVTKQKPGKDSPLEEHHVVFEERRVHGSKGFFTNPGGVPRVIPHDVINTYPVLVEKHSEGWEYVMSEPGEQDFLSRSLSSKASQYWRESMTTQIRDSIVYKGKERPLHSLPLEDFFHQGFPRPYAIVRPGIRCTACHRGYCAIWEIKNSELFLNDIKAFISSFTSSFGAMKELFDERGNANPLCPDCRKPYSKSPWEDEGYRPFCPHCGKYQSVRKCPACNKECPLAAEFCSRCGTSIGNWKCEECGGAITEWMEKFPPIPPHGFFCVRCGTRIWDKARKTEIENFYSYWHELQTKTSGKKKAHTSKKEKDPAIPPVKAVWYTSMLKIPDGACIESYTRSGFGANYEKEIQLHVEEGRVVKTEIQNNLTLEYLADLWIRSEGVGCGLRVDALLTAIEKSPHLSAADGGWHFPDVPPHQLAKPIIEARARREAFLSSFRDLPKFLRVKAD